MGLMKRYYRKKDGQLVYIANSATPEYWDKSWEKETEASLVKLYKSNSYVSTITKKYLPKNSIIIEGGCGRGNHVYALHENDYKAIGIDFAPDTVQFLNKTFPQLDIRVGDVRCSKLESGSVDGYWSLGVIEHFYSGFDDIADDITRVLRVGGYLFLTFPVMNDLRNLKAKLHLYDSFDGGGIEDFYQYALNLDLVIKKFKERGYKVVSCVRTGGFKGFKDESPEWLQYFLQKIYDSNTIVCKIIGRILDKLLSFFCGHIAMIVLQKSIETPVSRKN